MGTGAYFGVTALNGIKCMSSLAIRGEATRSRRSSSASWRSRSVDRFAGAIAVKRDRAARCTPAALSIKGVKRRPRSRGARCSPWGFWCRRLE